MDVLARRFDSLRRDKFEEFSEQEVILSEFLEDFYETFVLEGKSVPVLDLVKGQRRGLNAPPNQLPKNNPNMTSTANTATSLTFSSVSSDIAVGQESPGGVSKSILEKLKKMKEKKAESNIPAKETTSLIETISEPAKRDEISMHSNNEKSAVDQPPLTQLKAPEKVAEDDDKKDTEKDDEKNTTKDATENVEKAISEKYIEKVDEISKSTSAKHVIDEVSFASPYKLSEIAGSKTLFLGNAEILEDSMDAINVMAEFGMDSPAILTAEPASLVQAAVVDDDFDPVFATPTASMKFKKSNNNNSNSDGNLKKVVSQSQSKPTQQTIVKKANVSKPLSQAVIKPKKQIMSEKETLVSSSSIKFIPSSKKHPVNVMNSTKIPSPPKLSSLKPSVIPKAVSPDPVFASNPPSSKRPLETVKVEKGKEEGEEEKKRVKESEPEDFDPNDKIVPPINSSDDEEDDDYRFSKSGHSGGSEILQKKAKPVIPEWATTPFLRKTLQNQVEVNPESIFGNQVKTVNLNDVFHDCQGVGGSKK